MTDVTVSENATLPSEDYVSSFFSKIPTDAKFSRVSYQQVVPSVPIDKNSTTVHFILESLKSPMCYVISEILMSATVIITKQNKVDLPDVGANVGPVNCALSSLFSSCSMKINDISLTEGAEYYAYKNYLSNLMTFDEDAKITQLSTAGKKISKKKSNLLIIT